MANNTEDSSVGAMVYQGKPLSQWEKEFNGEFTAAQLYKLIRSGVDLGRVKLGLVDENEDEEAALDEKGTVEESIVRQPEDVVTVGDLIAMLRRNAQLDDKVMFRDGSKKECMLLDVSSKGGVTVVDMVVKKKGEPLDEVELSAKSDWFATGDHVSASDLKDIGQKAYPHNKAAWENEPIAGIVNGDVVEFEEVRYIRNESIPAEGTFFLLDGTDASLAAFEQEKKIMLESMDPVSPEQWKEAADWFMANGHPIEDDEERLDQFAPQGSQFLFKAGCSPTGKDEVISGELGWKLYNDMKAKGNAHVKESRGWYGGGYGGTGSSYSKLSGRAPRGAEIGWYAVGDLDPKAKGKMPGWRCGPSNFKFVDLLYPERDYKVGTMVMRNKYVKAGEMSGEKYIAVPSYFAAIKDNDQEAINLLNLLGIPLDLTFGMDPNDDYSVTYVLKKQDD